MSKVNGDMPKEFTDKKFLEWLRDRLEFVHHENSLYDYMQKFQAIIENYDKDKITTW